MFCPHCGSPNDDSSWQCASCGTALPRIRQKPPRLRLPHTMRRPENHLVKAILATLFCCLPFGIVAIVFAAQVNARAEAGDYAGAAKLSRQANFWGNLSIVLGLVAIVPYVLIMGLR